MQDPETNFEWQLAMDLAHGALMLDSARQYGLVNGGPQVNVERCEQIYSAARKKGVLPSSDSVEKFVMACQSGYGQGKARKPQASSRKPRSGGAR